ncbi:MAG: tRNA uridine(34) 5-carboxymethylaminomethyl modification radical SAM/GNAT enzyme Elp3 [Candidatus Aenigmarchaeota archaeon]|nr:tRNA uridine(34) 5-carboxymethylaminomethyl modification radical SAM/GNAT enzyme Elp3 [Candidatus Aenigmarchaeota archaeon]
MIGEKEFAKLFFKEFKQRGIQTKEDVIKLKRELAKSFGIDEPTNPDILKYASEKFIEKYRSLFEIKPTRTISGVATITVSSKPGFCGGNCTYCPPMSKLVPKSYSAKEPAIQRAIRNRFNAYKQVRDRLKQYKIMGHPTDKIEIIVLGGTFLAMDKSYQYRFIKGVFDGLNGKRASSLEEAKKMNETAKHRCVGLTIETRPDYCRERDIDAMLEFGCTRVEIGLQSIYDDVLEKVKRGHNSEESIKAIQIAKDAGLKIIAHIMPFLPGSSVERDIEMFKELFSNPAWQVDEFKIYPCVLVEGTELYREWLQGNYLSPTLSDVLKVIVEMKKMVPPWIRFRRIFRDIPADEIVAGPKKSNLREIAIEELKKQGLRCRCTRCREPGHAKKIYGIDVDENEIRLVRREYEASGGVEIFLSFEDTKNDVLIALLRLRMPYKPHRKEITLNTALIREIHTYGKLVPIQQSGDGWQHKGFGSLLLKEAERIAKEEFDKRKIIAISGVGVRQWFMRFGYRHEGPYMSKEF